jgi:hypothetical protein
MPVLARTLLISDFASFCYPQAPVPDPELYCRYTYYSPYTLALYKKVLCV